MKTIYEVIKEYLNRQKNPQYEEIGIITDPDGRALSYDNISNLKDPGEFTVGWIEFDSWFQVPGMPKRDRHVKLRGYINRYVEKRGVL